MNQASQGSQVLQDRKELQDHPVSQVYREGQGPKATPASQDSKVNMKFEYSRFRKDPQKSKKQVKYISDVMYFYD